MSFILGTFNEPPQFSHENFWRSMDNFLNSLLLLDVEHWDRILGALGLQTEHCTKHAGLDGVDFSTLSTYRRHLVGGFSSPVKGSRQRH